MPHEDANCNPACHELALGVKIDGRSMILEGLRREIQATVANEHDLDTARLQKVERLARVATDVLLAISDKESRRRLRRRYSLDDDDAMGNNMSTGVDSEQFGANALRNFLGSFQEAMRAAKETPESLVTALAEARKNGLDDVAALILEKLKAGSAASQVGQYLPGPTLTQLPPLDAEDDGPDFECSPGDMNLGNTGGAA